MNADTKIEALIGGHADVAFDHRVLDRYRASHRLDHAAELDESPIAGALEHAPVLGRDRGVDQFRSQCPQSRERSILVHAGHATETDDVGSEDSGDLAGFG